MIRLKDSTLEWLNQNKNRSLNVIRINIQPKRTSFLLTRLGVVKYFRHPYYPLHSFQSPQPWVNWKTTCDKDSFCGYVHKILLSYNLDRKISLMVFSFILWCWWNQIKHYSIDGVVVHCIFHIFILKFCIVISGESKWRTKVNFHSAINVSFGKLIRWWRWRN